MRLIERKHYLKKLMGAVETPDIKVIAGVRIIDVSDWLLNV